MGVKVHQFDVYLILVSFLLNTLPEIFFGDQSVSNLLL